MSKKLTDQQYVQRQGVFCPFCQGGRSRYPLPRHSGDGRRHAGDQMQLLQEGLGRFLHPLRLPGGGGSQPARLAARHI